MKLPRLSRLSSLALLCLVPTASVAMQEAAATPGDLPAARAILDRFVEVTRARELVEKTTSIHASGTFSLAGGQMEGPIQMWFKKPSQQRSEIELPMIGKMVQGCDGKSSWMTNAMTGARLSSGVELLQAQLEADFSARLKPDALFESLATLGRTTFDGRDCYEVQEVLRPLEGMDPEASLQARTLREYYEVATGLLAGMEVYTESDLFSGTVRTTLKEYGTFGGYPMVTRSVVETGPQVVEITIDDVEFDTVDDQVFSVPADVQALLDRAAKKAAPAPAGAQD